ncbi:eCIS core domain-containing protein [Myxococcus qinghaiensis]|uniref:eCIS core domain-containing protein n=1 Tax=Myxococcus qinghaiensis TaxID=2906758 RepID=UPI0020A72713|nr:DUF4157 domain-containing protein [Myxococcus qinghaiensis]MCP3166716.1 DUF4157 domain-containing protein [Myxococcus qinghaiensis]
MSDAARSGSSTPTPWTGPGIPIPDAVRGSLERFFGADFSDVRIHLGTEALKHGALAFATGSDLHFVPGFYAPRTPWGRHLLAHELTHVLQQRALKTALLEEGVLDDLDLEAQAERMGAAFARGELAPERLAPDEPASVRVSRAGPGPRVLQCYNIRRIYALAGGSLPDGDVFDDLQFIHDALNDQARMHVYFDFVNELVMHRVKDLGWTPTESLVLTFKESVEQVSSKLPKLFEPAPSELDFLKKMRTVGRPFHDVSAGLFHGEYEHALQLDFIRRMFEFKHRYDSTALKTSFRDVWRALFDEAFVLTIKKGGRDGENLNLSLWDVVMDIQGGFLRDGEKEPKGLTALPGEEAPLTKKGLYQGSFGTSATFMHHAFGAFGRAKPNDYEPITGIIGGTLARRYPYLAAAIIDRHMKRQQEAIKGGMGLNGYHVKLHSQKAKEERKRAVRNVIIELGGAEVFDWTVKPSSRTQDETDKGRPNTGLD